MIDTDFPERAAQCQIMKKDANEFLLEWCQSLGPMDRAVVFLDPYGMAVQWTTIEILAATKKVDFWMLFPSSSVIRMLPRTGLPQDAWARRLTELFGDESWRDEFYREKSEPDLFKEQVSHVREVSEESVANYFIGRLKKIFSGVVDRPLKLYNSRNSPLFMLVFAAGNLRSAPTAIRIASDINRNT